MSRGWELAANVLNAVSILLAARNSIHTWWTGIAGCVLFGVVFFATKLYADAVLQIFFIVTGAMGWWRWRHGRRGGELPVRRTPVPVLAAGVAGAAAITAGHGWLLHRFTDAFAPYPDSAVLAFSVLGQFLLMGRRYENWWCWLLVNTISVPLYLARGLYVTAALYAAFWVNGVVALVRWRRLVERA